MDIRLYDDIIQQIQLLVFPKADNLTVCNYDWPTDSERSMILRGDMAYELGGDQREAIGITLVTGNHELIKEDGVFLVGKDIKEHSEDCNYMRIAVVKIKESALNEDFDLYEAVRKLEYTRYHFYPKGFMMRVSSIHHRESVRISKKAVEDGLNFEITANMMIDEFKKNPIVEAVHIYYVTADSFDYSKALTLAGDAEDITLTIDHIFKNLSMDCNSCSLQKVCDEVEGLRELHFKQINKK